jgi:hypothetical protein
MHTCARLTTRALGNGTLPFVLCLAAAACSNPLAPEVFARPQPVDTSRVRIVVPEVYELANVIIAMTDYGRTGPYAVLRTGEYYGRVSAAFSPFRSHPSMKSLQLGPRDPAGDYYRMRDNSFAYVFEDNVLKRRPGARTSWAPNLFRERITAVQDFAGASGFREFYAANASYYREMIDRYAALADVDSLASWLERELPPSHYRYYTIVLSPLVYASHSADFVHGSDEAVFFVAGPAVTSGPGSSAGVRKATVQRILFTEVDHAFVNPVTDRHRDRVSSVFGSRSKWTTDASGFYESPIAVFNEYMTWAVFLLFIEGRISDEDFSVVRQNTIGVMEGSRRFQRFGAFAGELSRLYRNRPAGTKAADLYPAILDWAAKP